MNVMAFLRDRWPYILMFVAVVLLLTAVFQLDLWLIDVQEPRWGAVWYGALLALVGLGVFLASEYRRQAAFFRQFEQILGAESADKLAVLDEPVTLEQRLFADGWARMYGLLQADLAAERRRGQQRIRLLSQWAHHMKTPVSVIDLEIQRARQIIGAGGHDAGRHEHVEAFVESVAEENARIGDSLHILLNIIRLDEFAADFRVAQVDLLDLVRQTVNDFRRAFIVHRVYPKIAAEGPEGEQRPWVVESDWKWLRLILEQIIGNAIKYGARPDGDGRVEIRLCDQGDETVLEVADDGIGIPKEDLGRVFEPFYTGAAGRAHVRSTGMGLYLAREAAHRLGHRISLRSQVGEGTAVRIHFRSSGTLLSDLKSASLKSVPDPEAVPGLKSVPYPKAVPPGSGLGRGTSR